MIIQDIDTIGTSIVEFLCRSKKRWCVKELIKTGATLVDLMFIEELEEDEAME
jgi:hypothetical protein